MAAHALSHRASASVGGVRPRRRRSREEALRGGLRATAFDSAVVGMLGGVGVVIAGLIMTRGRLLGGGHERIHHSFVWPAVVTCVVFVGTHPEAAGIAVHVSDGCKVLACVSVS
jgi:hypothetical protein